MLAEQGVDSRASVVVIVRACAVDDFVGDAGELWPEIRVLWMPRDQVRDSPLEVIKGRIEFEARSHVPILARRRCSALTARRFATARRAAASMTAGST